MTIVRLCVLAAVCGLLCATAAAGLLPTETISGYRTYGPVEPWSGYPIPTDSSVWVVNPTGCLWDPDDTDHIIVTGALNPAAEAVLTDCIVANPDPIWMTANGTTAWWHWAPHPNLTFDVRAPSPSLGVAICYQPQDVCFALQPQATPTGYEYTGCAQGPIYTADSPAVQPIVGSNGGYGVLTTVTFRIRNSTTRKILKVAATVDGGNDQACQGTRRRTVAADYSLEFFQP